MGLQLTLAEYEYLKNEDLSLFPTDSVKIIKEEHRDILIIDLNKVYNVSICTKLEFLGLVEQYESLGWKYYCGISQYIYFYRTKNSFIEKIKKIFQ